MLFKNNKIKNGATLRFLAPYNFTEFETTVDLNVILANNVILKLGFVFLKHKFQIYSKKLDN